MEKIRKGRKHWQNIVFSNSFSGRRNGNPQHVSAKYPLNWVLKRFFCSQCFSNLPTEPGFETQRVRTAGSRPTTVSVIFQTPHHLLCSSSQLSGIGLLVISPYLKTVIGQSRSLCLIEPPFFKIFGLLFSGPKRLRSRP